ncbi:hypothetical protein TWF730_004442 [Orbilia blumenaviensis]|uniref:Uncharacterized protein n=1 Tax=Orbilia blumenaviensis TaxID=1796055 RepID=A0AAV9TYL3_9PEZI
MWLLPAIWLFVALLHHSNAYFISVNLQPVETDPLNLSPEDSIEEFFDGLERPSTSILEGTRRLLPALEATDDNSTPGGLGIAGRISLPAPNLRHPIAGYHGSNSRRVSEILGGAAGIPLARTTSGKSQASSTSQQREEDGFVVATTNVPSNSRGRCFELQAPERDSILQSIILSEFAEEDEVPIGLSLFSAPGCRKNRGFVGYSEIDRTSVADTYTVDLEFLQQPIANYFSILPVYGGSDTETPLYHSSDEDINQDIGVRPEAPSPLLNVPRETTSDDDLLANTIERDFQRFNVPWDKLEGARSGDEEEKREATPPSYPQRHRPSPWYINPTLPVFQGFEITSSSPRNWNVRSPDSDDALDSAHVVSRGPRGESDPISSANNNIADHVALDIEDYDLGEGNGSEDGDRNPNAFQVGDEVFIRGYPDPWLWEINAYPETADLEPWQYPEHRGKTSSEDRPFG